MPKRWCFPWKKDGRHLVYVLEYMLTLVSFDKMQNISTLMRKSSKSEGRSFWKLFKWNWFKPSSKLLLLTVPRQYFFSGSFILFLYYFCHAFLSAQCCLVVTCWKGLTSWLSFVVLNWVVVTFPFGILGQVWYLIVSIPDLCPLSYFHTDHIVLLCVQIFSEQRFFAFISLCADWSHNDHQNLMHLYTA